MQEESHFLIIGLGLLGGSYAQGLKRKGYHVSALDINPESIAYALEQGWIDEGAVGFDEKLVAQADSIVFGLYPQALLEWIDQHQDSFAPNTRITDVTGVKEQIVTQVQQKLRPDVEFIAVIRWPAGRSAGFSMPTVQCLSRQTSLLPQPLRIPKLELPGLGHWLKL